VELWHAIVLGLVEGITEYLPISSTGHLILARDIMGLGGDAVTRRNVDDFTIVVQGGAILAVLWVYWPTAMRMVRGLLGKDAGGLRLVRNLAVAFTPAAAIGLLLEDTIDAHLFSAWAVLLALVVGGFYMIGIDLWRAGRMGLRPMTRCDDVTNVTVGQALTIGLLQCIAMWPGTSRSMMTITGGLFAGLTPRAAAEFSFLLGLPTLGAACVYKLGKNLLEARQTNTPNLFEQLGWLSCAVGIAVAAVSAAIAVKWLVRFLTKHGLAPFGWYRIALALVMGVLIWQGIVRV
jgi:undecaprenyl-diphosphatase